MMDMQSQSQPPHYEPRSRGWEFLKGTVARKMESVSRKKRLRALRPTIYPSENIDLTNNDYLGLRAARSLRQDIIKDLPELPFGSGGSRLLGGEWPQMRELENSFASFVGFEDALFFPSGYAANGSLIRALYQPQTAIFSDKLNHASILDGIKMAGFEGPRKNIFKHNDMDHLEHQLKNSQAACNIIITESLFSMDGDAAPLQKLSELAERYQGVLVIDEAHSIGIHGHQGRGLIEASKLDTSKIIGVFPCGKALGSQGAFIAGPSWLRPFLINYSREFIYTTAPSPWIVRSLQKVIELLPHLDGERTRLSSYSAQLRQDLRNNGWPLLAGDSHIIPILVGKEQEALDWERKFWDRGIVLRAIRPPTVLPGQCRLRISLSAGISSEEFFHIREVFSDYASH